MWRNTVAIHNILKKKTTKLNFQPAPYEKNKINKKNFKKKTQKLKKEEEKKIMWEKTSTVICEESYSASLTYCNCNS
jgi:hypothetical protein